MVLWCPVGASVLCVMTDPACQNNGQPYTALSALASRSLGITLLSIGIPCTLASSVSGVGVPLLT
jgi:hypothetical protein